MWSPRELFGSNQSIASKAGSRAEHSSIKAEFQVAVDCRCSTSCDLMHQWVPYSGPQPKYLYGSAQSGVFIFRWLASYFRWLADRETRSVSTSEHTNDDNSLYDSLLFMFGHFTAANDHSTSNILWEWNNREPWLLISIIYLLLLNWWNTFICPVEYRAFESWLSALSVSNRISGRMCAIFRIEITGLDLQLN